MSQDQTQTATQERAAFRVAYLIAGYIDENITADERAELDEWRSAGKENQELFLELTDPQKLQAWVNWKEKLMGSITDLPTARQASRTTHPAYSATGDSRTYIASAVVIALILLTLFILWWAGKSAA